MYNNIISTNPETLCLMALISSPIKDPSFKTFTPKILLRLLHFFSALTQNWTWNSINHNHTIVWDFLAPV